MKLTLPALLAALTLASAVHGQTPPAPGAAATDAPPAAADPRAARGAARAACVDDAKALCPGQTGREAMACLREHADKLGDSCKTAMSKLSAAAGERPRRRE